MFSCTCLSVSAADDKIVVSDMHASMYTETDTGSGINIKDYAYTDGTETRSGILFHWFSAVDRSFYAKGSNKVVSAYDYSNLSAGHEYEITFYTNVNFTADYTVTVKMGLGNVIYEKKVSKTGQPQKFNVKYTAPDAVTNETRLTIELSFDSLYGYGSNSGDIQVKYMISEEVNLTDLTENPSWLGKILKRFDDIGDWFRNLGSSITSGFDNLKQSVGNWFSDVGKWFKEQGEKIQAFSDGVKQWFQDLGDKIGDYFTILYNDLIDGLKSLFIPSEGYFDAYMEKTKTWAAERFGFLYTAADLMSSMVTDLQGLLRDDYLFVLPAAKFTLDGTTYTLWEGYTLPMDDLLQNDFMKYAYGLYKTLLGAACAFALFKYAQSVFDKVMAN